ncbi:GspH/FimT family pseudopilin [Thiohalophilus sp.]|uniref:GspH/FimT family pseudopilin n=1 Tax=Thiohalophilus sp. TaxID=3028392 RepID=UPI002ACDFB97|nr:GspH/FimT family pseudopilin [Thiohalophilus sp.]MDZ7662775.1 GspH/FimT family pseudopilin [Thiohalophilus sp.]
MDVIHTKSRCRTDRGGGHSNSFVTSRGFTLLELIVVIAVASILLGLGVPSLGPFLSSERGVTRMNNLAASLALTRSEAIKRNQHVVLCKSPGGEYCQRKGASWHDGWIVFVDRDHDRRRGDDEPIIQHQGSGNVDQTLTYAAFGSRHYITYRPSGMTRTNGTFTLCDPRYPDNARALILMKTGRVRSSRVKANGEPLEC